MQYAFALMQRQNKAHVVLFSILMAERIIPVHM